MDISSLEYRLMSHANNERRETSGFHINLKLKLNYLDRVGDYDYKTAPFFHSKAHHLLHSDWFRVNESLAVALNIICNVLVIVVFVRVITSHRLPSKVIINMAAANLMSAVTHLVHTLSVTVDTLSEGIAICRFAPQFVHQTIVLILHVMSAAIIERMLAFNVPRYYNRAVHIIAPAILIGPWFLWLINLSLVVTEVFHYDLGYECGSHLSIIMVHPAMNSGSESALILMAFLLFILFLSLLFRHRSSGDIIEINRQTYELKTTKVVLRVCGLALLISLPVVIKAPTIFYERLDHEGFKQLHTLSQISIHRGLALMLALLCRKDFREQLRNVFRSRSEEHARHVNLLLAMQENRRAFGRSFDGTSFSEYQMQLLGRRRRSNSTVLPRETVIANEPVRQISIDMAVNRVRERERVEEPQKPVDVHVPDSFILQGSFSGSFRKWLNLDR